MNKRNSSLIQFAVCLLIWGTAVPYWNLFPKIDLIFKVSCRVLFSAIFGFVCLAFVGRLDQLKTALLDKNRIMYICLSSLCIGANWLIYVWAISNGHVVDASLGNYMNPIAISVVSFIVFKEKADALQIISLSVAFLGLIISVIAYGNLPYVGLMIMASFTAYTLLKKKAHTDGLVATTLETGLLAPLALAYMLIFGSGNGGFGSIDSIWTALLLLSTGPYTAIPFILYASGVNNFSALFIGLASMFTPTITLLTGIISYGEALSGASLINFICVLIAIMLFIVSIICKGRKKNEPSVRSSSKTIQI